MVRGYTHDDWQREQEAAEPQPEPPRRTHTGTMLSYTPITNWVGLYDDAGDLQTELQVDAIDRFDFEGEVSVEPEEVVLYAPLGKEIEVTVRGDDIESIEVV